MIVPTISLGMTNMKHILLLHNFLRQNLAPKSIRVQAQILAFLLPKKTLLSNSHAGSKITHKLYLPFAIYQPILPTAWRSRTKVLPKKKTIISGTVPASKSNNDHRRGASVYGIYL
jgi:hypothetical protein